MDARMHTNYMEGSFLPEMEKHSSCLTAHFNTKEWFRIGNEVEIMGRNKPMLLKTAQKTICNQNLVLPPHLKSCSLSSHGFSTDSEGRVKPCSLNLYESQINTVHMGRNNNCFRILPAYVTEIEVLLCNTVSSPGHYR